MNKEATLTIEETHKTYWSGNLRILSDVLWCIFISLLLTWSESHSLSSDRKTTTLPTSTQIGKFVESTSECGDYLKPRSSREAISHQISSFFGRVMGCFFMFFFWTWNREHVKCRIARSVIHLFCWSYFAISLFALGFLVAYYPKSLSEFTGWYVLILVSSLSFFIIRKYRKIMRSI